MAADLGADMLPAPAILALDVEQLLGEVGSYHAVTPDDGVHRIRSNTRASRYREPNAGFASTIASTACKDCQDISQPSPKAARRSSSAARSRSMSAAFMAWTR